MAILTLPAAGAGIACALAYSSADYFRKTVPAGISPAVILFYFVALHIPVLSAWVWLTGDFRVPETYWGIGLLDAAAGLAANLLFVVGLRRSPLSLIVPLLGLIPATTLLIGGIVLSEWPTWRQSLGIGLMVVGLLALYAPGRSLDPRGALRRLVSEPGAPPMAAVILLWSLTPALDKISIARTTVGVHGLIQVSLISAALGAWILHRGGRRPFVAPRGARGPLLASGMAGGLGYILQLTAYGLTLVAVVELIKRVGGMVGAVVFGHTLLREPLTPGKAVGMGVMALGLPLIILG